MVNGALRTSSFFVPTGLAVNHVSGVIYVADSNNHRIRSIDCSKGSVSTVAGSAHFGFRDGPADTAEFQVGGWVNRCVGDFSRPSCETAVRRMYGYGGAVARQCTVPSKDRATVIHAMDVCQGLPPQLHVLAEPYGCGTSGQRRGSCLRL